MVKLLTWPRLHQVAMKVAINNDAQKPALCGNFVETSHSLCKVKKHVIVHLDPNICDVPIEIRVGYVQIFNNFIKKTLGLLFVLSKSPKNIRIW